MMIGRITATNQSELTKRQSRGAALLQRRKTANDFRSVLDKEMQRAEQNRKKKND